MEWLSPVEPGLGIGATFYGKHRLDRSSSAPLAAGFLQDGVALAAEEMASRYAVAATGVVDERVQMTVSGVYEFSDYTAIVSWLESLELIEHANIESIRGDSVEFGLDAAADAAQLISIIETERPLAARRVVAWRVSLPMAQLTPSEPIEVYRWPVAIALAAVICVALYLFAAYLESFRFRRPDCLFRRPSG